MSYAILDQCIGFEWDAGNEAKSSLKHGVSQAECEEMFFNMPLLTTHDAAHSRNEPRYYALGHTDEGRLLFVAFTIRRKHIRVISSRPMSRKERKIYEAQATRI